MPLFRGYSIGKDLVAAQIVSLALETDRCPPALLICTPVYAGDAAGVIPADGLGPQHLHAGAVYVRQSVERRVLSQDTAAAGGVAAAQVDGLGHGLPAAVAPAQPGGPVPDVVHRMQDRQPSEALSGQVELFSAMAGAVHKTSSSGYTAETVSKLTALPTLRLLAKKYAFLPRKICI